MQIESPETDLIIVKLNRDEAIKLRRWIDDNNPFDSEKDALADDLSDELFDLTYEPVRA